MKTATPLGGLSEATQRHKAEGMHRFLSKATNIFDHYRS